MSDTIDTDALDGGEVVKLDNLPPNEMLESGKLEMIDDLKLAGVFNGRAITIELDRGLVTEIRELDDE